MGTRVPRNTGVPPRMAGFLMMTPMKGLYLVRLKWTRGGLMRPLRRSRILRQRCISQELAQLVPETHRKAEADGGNDGEGDGGRRRARRGGVRLPERKRAREGTDRDQEGRSDHREFDDGADHDRRRRGLQRYDRNRPERGGAGGEECRRAGGGGWRGVEKHLAIQNSRPRSTCCVRCRSGRKGKLETRRQKAGTRKQKLEMGG